MRVTIRGTKTRREAVELREYIERRSRFALGRLADELLDVVVVLEDLNGPRGGVDKRCLVQLHGPVVREVVVEGTDVAWGPAIDRALSLAGRAVVRALDRARGEAARRSGGAQLRGEVA